MNAKKVYELLSQIPKGKITTYKEIGKALNSKAYRAIGTIIGKNPRLIAIPCHRVVRSDGKVGGYASGSAKKIQILTEEGIQIMGDKVVNCKDKIRIF